MGDEREEGERGKENERKQRKESKWRGRRRERVGSLAAGAALQIDLLRLACIHGWRYHKHDSCVCAHFIRCRRRHRRAGSGANRLASLSALRAFAHILRSRESRTNWKGGRKDIETGVEHFWSQKMHNTMRMKKKASFHSPTYGLQVCHSPAARPGNFDM